MLNRNRCVAMKICSKLINISDEKEEKYGNTCSEGLYGKDRRFN